MGFYRGPNIVTDGLVYAFDAGSGRSYDGTTSLNDLVGSNTGTLTNGVTYQSINGGVFDFDGTDDHIELNTAMSFANAFTFNCWFIKDNNGENTFLGKTGSSEKLIFLSNNNIFLRVINGGSANNFDIDYTTALNGEWQFLTVARTSSGLIKASLNGGALINGATRTGTFTPNTIAENSDGQYWAGKLANNLIYNRELTQTEVTQNYNAQKSRFGL
jgi:hypothetical protein